MAGRVVDSGIDNPDHGTRTINMRRTRIHTREQQDREIARLSGEIEEILHERRQQRWHRITWRIVVPVCLIILLVIFVAT